jgi:ABC-type ATPase with predicted acetyltransferase domain
VQQDSIQFSLTILVNGEEKRTVVGDYDPSSGAMTVIKNTVTTDLSKIQSETNSETSIESVLIVTSTGMN